MKVRDGVPGTKVARHQAIAHALNSNFVRSQGELQDLLAMQGFSVTQATLSRDLDEMGATKIRDMSGVLRYTLPAYPGHIPSTSAHASNKLGRWCQELLVNASVALNQVIIKTPPGSAQILASAIDSARIPDVLGCVAGDDTILIVTPDSASASVIRRTLVELSTGRRIMPA
ncbi:MAG: ArgR family transcriptional regulator [Actinomycetaceae bacterium]|nr:ArgR family transcriptional regulator [Actinomycetaceae bacterium]